MRSFLLAATVLLAAALPASAQYYGCYNYAYYQAYQPTYYQPVYYRPYSYAYNPPKQETTADDLLKALLIQKLAADLGVGEKAAAPKSSPLTPEELQKLRALLAK